MVISSGGTPHGGGHHGYLIRGTHHGEGHHDDLIRGTPHGGGHHGDLIRGNTPWGRRNNVMVTMATKGPPTPQLNNTFWYKSGKSLRTTWKDEPSMTRWKFASIVALNSWFPFFSERVSLPPSTPASSSE